MKRILAAMLAGVTLAGAGSAFAADDGDAAQMAADTKAVQAAAAQDDCAAGLSAARRLIASPRFAATPGDFRLMVLRFGAQCAHRAGQAQEALDDVRQATALPGADDDLWLERLQLGGYLKHPQDVADAAEELSEGGSHALNRVKPRLFLQVLMAERAARRTVYAARILSALEKADYRPLALDERADRLWLDAADLAIDAGDTAGAASLLQRVDSPALLHARLDRRFATIVQSDPERFDILAAAKRQLAADRVTMVENPDRLGAVTTVVQDLRGLQRYDEALLLAQSALDRAAAGTAAHPAFTDQRDHLNWMQDEKAHLLIKLGRIDEALAAQRRGADIGEDGRPGNVSQTINLADMYNLVGRPRDALAILPASGGLLNASPYGLAVLHAKRACALQQLGGGAEMRAELDYLAAHATENPAARLDAAMCAGDLDAAAAMIIARLQDEDDREQMLVDLCEFPDSPHPTSFEKLMDQRAAALRRRPDVQAAIAKVGHIETLPLDEAAFVDLD